MAVTGVTVTYVDDTVREFSAGVSVSIMAGSKMGALLYTNDYEINDAEGQQLAIIGQGTFKCIVTERADPDAPAT